jgi:hypothetical protein
MTGRDTIARLVFFFHLGWRDRGLRARLLRDTFTPHKDPKCHVLEDLELEVAE